MVWELTGLINESTTPFLVMGTIQNWSLCFVYPYINAVLKSPMLLCTLGVGKPRNSRITIYGVFNRGLHIYIIFHPPRIRDYCGKEGGDITTAIDLGGPEQSGVFWWHYCTQQFPRTVVACTKTCTRLSHWICQHGVGRDTQLPPPLTEELLTVYGFCACFPEGCSPWLIEHWVYGPTHMTIWATKIGFSALLKQNKKNKTQLEMELGGEWGWGGSGRN